MDLIERRGSSGTGAARLLARWVLLGAVIAAVFALHVLSAESDAGGHGAVPAVTAGHQVPVLDAASTASVTDVGTGPSRRPAR